MAVGNEELVIISGDTGEKAPEIPTFKNQQEYDNWWNNMRIDGVPPRDLNDLEVVAVIQGANNQIKRFRDVGPDVGPETKTGRKGPCFLVNWRSGRDSNPRPPA